MMKFATIYLLRNELRAAVYVGSTFHTLPWRFARHRSACKCDPCSPLHRYGVEHGNMERWTIAGGGGNACGTTNPQWSAGATQR